MKTQRAILRQYATNNPHLLDAYVTRRNHAAQQFIATIAELGGIDTAAAESVARLYLRRRFAKYDGNRYTVTHGAFLNRDAIGRAVTMAADDAAQAATRAAKRNAKREG